MSKKKKIMSLSEYVSEKGKPKGKAKNTPKEPKKFASQRCFHSHPALPIKDGLVVYGGSCSSPVIKDADIYVGFDWGMGSFSQMYPWHDGEAFLFKIPDMGVPSNVAEFKLMIHYIAENIVAGKKIHMGCIGGHGRTGLVMAALIKHMTGEVDATNYVRKHYCKKAVESAKQIDWLYKNFKIKKAKPAKTFSTVGFSDSPGQQSLWYEDKYNVMKSQSSRDTSDMLDSDKQIHHIPVTGSVWGSNRKK